MATASKRSFGNFVPESIVNRKDEKQSLLYVKKGEAFGGYALHLLKEDLPPYLKSFVICSVCDGVLRDACGVGNPQVFMCLSCAQGRNSTGLKPNREVAANLTITCPLKSRGCSWEGNISESEAHLDTCDFFRIDCQLSCGTVVERCAMQVHFSTKCPLREIHCTHCMLSHKEKETNIHQKKCGELPLLCPNQCGSIVKRQSMGHHVDHECENTLLECPYKEYGCEVRLARKEMVKHKRENRLVHLEIKTDSLCEELHIFKNENMKLKREVSLLESLSSFEGKLIFRIWNLEKLDKMRRTVATFIINSSNGFNQPNGQIYISCYKSDKNTETAVNRSKLIILGNVKLNQVSPILPKLRPSSPDPPKLSTNSTLRFSPDPPKLSTDATLEISPNPPISSASSLNFRYDATKFISNPLKLSLDIPKSWPELPQFSFLQHGQVFKKPLTKLNLNGCIIITNESHHSVHSKYEYSVDFDLKDKPLLFPLPTSFDEVLTEIPYQQILHPDVCVNDNILVHLYYNLDWML